MNIVIHISAEEGPVDGISVRMGDLMDAIGIREGQETLANVVLIGVLTEALRMVSKKRDIVQIRQDHHQTQLSEARKAAMKLLGLAEVEDTAKDLDDVALFPVEPPDDDYKPTPCECPEGFVESHRGLHAKGCPIAVLTGKHADMPRTRRQR